MKINTKLFWIYLISASIYAVQGGESLPSLSLFFFLKEKLNFTPEKIMYIGSLIGLAWIIKPIWGFLCDNYFNKKTWIILSLIGSIVISGYFGLASWLPLAMIILMASLGGITSAIRDVAVDGIMCVDGKQTNSCDKIQSIQWIAITVASIIVGLVGGYIADHFNYKFAYLCLIPIYLIILYVILKYKPTKNAEREESCGCCKHYEPCSGNDNQICESFTYKKQSLKDNILSYKELFTNKQFLWICLFLFLYKYSPSFGTPLSFIERDSFKWSGMWMGTLGAIVSCFSIIGAVVYFKFCKKLNIRKWLIGSVFLGAVTTLAYLYFTPVTAVIYGIMFSVIGMFIHLIIMSFMANSTIKGKEATSFALLCSVNNFAGTASSLSGAWLFPLVGLQWLIILSAVTSFICLPLIKKLNIK